MSVRWSEAGPVSELLAQWSLTVSSMSGEASNSLTWVSDSAAPRHIVAGQLKDGWKKFTYKGRCGPASPTALRPVSRPPRRFSARTSLTWSSYSQQQVYRSRS
jgi:hypothetical protein